MIPSLSGATVPGMTVADILRAKDVARARGVLQNRGFPDPAHDPLVFETCAGLHTLRLRDEVRREWHAWAEPSLGALRPLLVPPPSAATNPGWDARAEDLGTAAGALIAKIEATLASFQSGSPADRTTGRPRRMVRNFVFTLDWVWTLVGRVPLTPSVLALEALVSDEAIGGGLWAEAMDQISPHVNPIDPWKDRLRTARRVDVEEDRVDTFTVRQLLRNFGSEDAVLAHFREPPVGGARREPRGWTPQ